MIVNNDEFYIPVYYFEMKGKGKSNIRVNGIFCVKHADSFCN